ncbi:[acyl-carrier-protein] S-malonyltransferase [Paramicrobacterium humi]|uniref:[acyl-carrier-protein] S-malonyltransferase n=1 Tax=Paramicrobacterium humi TaxID=640635 RepID=A0A1H4QH95_9MICO|nr:ACP S-malonyltransferase [Microbacterium humi]SEC18908.1 [acyl-carrier-protein] S-malonyltransferase [Microbacterium humi]
MIVIVCPGQGSQKPGFLAPWLDSDENKALLADYSDAAGLDLAAHGTTSDAETIKDTAIAQPLIVAAGLLALRALDKHGALDRVGGIAGHSVGEITAAAGAGILDVGDAMDFVSQRAVAMAEAANSTPTGMSAVLGGEPDEVIAAAESLGLQPANYNGGGQIVVAGDLHALARLADEPPAKARVMPLKVAGAFHTRYMEPAREFLAAAASLFTASDPKLRIWTNSDGTVVSDGERFRDLLVKQVASPVRWDLCMQSFAENGVTGLIELAPAGALIGLARRGLKGVPTVAVNTPDDIPAALQMIDAAA